jgi:5,10-methylenetetrahydromethanopterin reductase
MTEFWTALLPNRPADVPAAARRAEADGWDGLGVADTQCLFGEAFVSMSAAAVATTRLKLSLATSNPVTRHPAVAASGIATVQAIAGDRVRYGIGRGDSALAYLGAAPASVTTLDGYVTAVRQYLHRQPVPYDSLKEWRLTDDVASIELGHAPEYSSLTWLTDSLPPVPIDVYATGPRVLRLGGRSGDGVVLSVGADPNRLRWAMDVARKASEDAGRDPARLSFTAICLVGISDDLEEAHRSLVNVVASAARFAVMSGRVVGPVSEAQRQVYESIARSYDMSHHGGAGAQVDVLTGDFVDSFAIAGSPSRCVERIVELTELGIDSFVLGPPRADATDPPSQIQYRLMVDSVLPEIRARTAQ